MKKLIKLIGTCLIAYGLVFTLVGSAQAQSALHIHGVLTNSIHWNPDGF